MRHTLVVLLQDRADALSRALAVLNRRQCQMHSMSVGPSEHAGMQRVTFVFESDDVAKITGKLCRLTDVAGVQDVSHAPLVERESVLLRLGADTPELRAAAGAGARTHRGEQGGTVVEYSGTPAEVDTLVERLRPFGIRELARSGRIVMTSAGDNGTKAAPGASHVLPGGVGSWWSRAEGASGA